MRKLLNNWLVRYRLFLDRLPRKWRLTLVIVGYILLISITILGTFLTLLLVKQGKSLKLTLASQDSPYMYTAVDPGRFKAYIVDKSTNEPTVKAEFPGSVTAEFKMRDLDKTLKKPTRRGNKINFSDILPTIDLTYETLPNGIKENIILNEKVDRNQFNFTVSTNGAAPRLVKNNLYSTTFFDQENRYVFHLAEPFAVDSRGERTFDAHYLIQPTATPDEYEINLFVNSDWLNDPARNYPVTIDPTIIYSTTSQFAGGQFNRAVDTGSGSNPNLTTNYQENIADIYTIGLWHMNETVDNSCAGGQDICDSSSNGKHGVGTGTTINTASPVLGTGARTFNGASEYITLPNLGLSGNVPYTVSFWTKPVASTNIEEPFSFSGSEIVRNYPSAGNLTMFNGSARLTTTFPSTGIWHHIALVSTGNHLTFYVDGIQTATTLYSASVTDSAYVIGRSGPQNTYPYKGDIDEVHVSNIARSAEEIKLEASRRPYSVYTSPVISLGDYMYEWNPFSWTEFGVRTGDGETLKDTTNLVAQWNFNEKNGTSAVNSAGSCGASCNGTLTNFASTTDQDVTPLSGWTYFNRRWGAGALMFDGADDFISINDHNSLSYGNGSLDTPFSISMWVFPRNFTSGYQWLIGKRGTNQEEYQLTLDPTTGIIRNALFSGLATSGYIGRTGSNAPIIGKWNHIVMTYDGSRTENGIKLYLNGKEMSTTTNSVGTYTAMNNGTSPINIGRYSGGSYYFSGNIDSTAIFSRVLSPAEILSNYNSSNLEFQTRVGQTNVADDGSWEPWSTTAGEFILDNFDSTEATIASGCTATGGTTPDGGNTFIFKAPEKKVFYYTAADQQYVVPEGVTSITVKMWGAGGGGGAPGGWSWGYPGGGGGYTTATLAVTPGQVLDVMVGGGGINGTIKNYLPVYGGGGPSCMNSSGSDCRYGGSGGGRSAIRYNNTDLITAGGGGGGGSKVTSAADVSGGGGGGATGQNGVAGASATAYGRGGTQSAGGAGGTGANSGGRAGSQYLGGSPLDQSYGGGGGGGWYGGGSGAYDLGNTMGGGGGGSSYVGGSGVSNGSTIAASGSTQANAADADNRNAGLGGQASTNGKDGKVVITADQPIPSSFTCTSGGQVEVLVVAGGGGGGMDMGGGGGGGGVIHKPNFSVSANTPIPVSVGYGGVGAPAGGAYGQPTGHQFTLPATNGANTVFGSLTAIGGGAGGSSYYQYSPGAAGYAGGSGGGASGYSDGGTRVGGNGTVGQGFKGGNAGGQYYSGGGGGAGNPGTNSTAVAHGGNGYFSDILGLGFYWGGGGGGSGYSVCGGNGGAGGGGGGGVCTTSGGSGYNNGQPGGGGSTGAQTNRPGGDGGLHTGGGGGGGSHYNANNRGGDGGSGIVIVRRIRTNYDSQTKQQGSNSQKTALGVLQTDSNTTGLWHFDQLSSTATYGYTGTNQTYTVPAGVTSLTVKMWGAGGGGGAPGGWTYGYPGGGGGYTTGTLAVSPGQVLDVMVGGGGTNGSIKNFTALYGGGGPACNNSGATDCAYGGSGGGRSAIRYNNADLITAGGGGGGGSKLTANFDAGGGGGGGSTGQDGFSIGSNTAYGRGGTQSAGGAGGTGSNSNGSAGSQYLGGTPLTNSYGAGGGGGWYGGGAGGYDLGNNMGGGGGGSSYVGGSGVSNGSTIAAIKSLPGNFLDLLNGGAGVGGPASANGAPGKVVIIPNQSTQGTLEIDSSPLANHAVLTNSTRVNGVNGKAINISSTGYITHPMGNISTSGTIEMWLKPNWNGSDGLMHGIWQSYNSSAYDPANSIEMFKYTNNTIYLRVVNPSGGMHDCTFGAAGTFIANKWIHLAFTYSGSSLVGYINGTPVCTNSSAISVPNALIDGYGRIGYGYASSFNGIIDEVRLSKVVRTPEEIESSYRLGQDTFLKRVISSNDLSSKTSLPFYVAADRPGTYLEAMFGESDFANYQPDDNTVAFWHFSETNGSSSYVKDSGTSRSNGTPDGTTSIQGKIGKGRMFSGSNDINLGAATIADGLANFTVDAWLYPTAQTADTHYRVFSEESTLYVGQYGNQASFYMGNGTVWTNQSISMGTLTLNQWNHVAWVKSGTTGYVYINGILTGTLAAPASLGSNASTNFISTFDGNIQGFSGIIDELRISNIARSSEDIRQAHQVGFRTHPITIDFGARLDSNNLIANSSDTVFFINATPYGATSKGSNIYNGDKIIIHELPTTGGEYIAQGTVSSVDVTRGVIIVSSWDAASTFPPGGFTVNADVFKWQREYFDITGTLLSHRDAATQFNIHVTNGNESRLLWLDDLRSAGPYLTNPIGSTIGSTVGLPYLQFRFIGSSSDLNTAASITSTTVGGSAMTPESPTPGTATALSSSSIQWNFTDNASNELGFKVYDTNSNLVATCVGANLNSCTETGISGESNSLITRKLTAYNAYGNSIYTDSIAKYTLAAVPPTPTVINRAANSATIDPNLGTNAASTELAIYKEVGTTCDGSGGTYLAADGSENGSTPVWQTDAAWGARSVTGLSSESVYSFCIVARNGNNIVTAFSTTNSYNAGYVPITGDFVYSKDASNSSVFANRYIDGSNPSRFVIGVDNGTTDNAANTAKFEVQSGILTINSTDTLVVGELSLTGGSVALAEGAVMKLGEPLWFVDADGDGYGSNRLYVGPKPTNGRRKPLAASLASNDCNDAIYSSSNSCHGDGHDGAVTIAANKNINTDIIKAGRTYADGVAYSVSAIGTNTVTTSVAPNGIATGDEIMIINLQGIISGYANVGQYELQYVTNVAGSVLTLQSNIAKTYGNSTNSNLTNQKIIVQRVPNYSDVTINNGVSLTANAWNGASGGLLAFRASGTVNVNGSINLAGIGYRGGTTDTDQAPGGESFCGVNNGSGGNVNGGVAGTCGGGGGGGTIGAAYPGGSGGVGGSGGGGGVGGNANIGVWGGSGGNAGYGSAASGGGVNASGSGNYGSRDSNYSYGGAGGGGGTYGSSNLTTLFAGSGGGKGGWAINAACSLGGNGGRGGGIIYLEATTLNVAATGSITTNGGGGGGYVNVWANCYDAWGGNGGSGSGGSIFIKGNTVAIGTGKVTSSGGSGSAGNGRIGIGAVNLTGTSTPSFTQLTYP